MGLVHVPLQLRLNCIALPPQRHPADLDCATLSACLPLDYIALPASLIYTLLRSPAGLVCLLTASPRLSILTVQSHMP